MIYRVCLKGVGFCVWTFLATAVRTTAYRKLGFGAVQRESGRVRILLNARGIASSSGLSTQGSSSPTSYSRIRKRGLKKASGGWKVKGRSLQDAHMCHFTLDSFDFIIQNFINFLCQPFAVKPQGLNLLWWFFSLFEKTVLHYYIPWLSS